MVIDSEVSIGIFHTEPFIGDILVESFRDAGYDAAVFNAPRGSLLVSDLIDSLGSNRFKVAVLEVPFPYDKNTLLCNFAAKACADSGVNMIGLSSSASQVMENSPSFPVVNTPYRLDELINLVKATAITRQSDLVTA